MFDTAVSVHGMRVDFGSALMSESMASCQYLFHVFLLVLVRDVRIHSAPRIWRRVCVFKGCSHGWLKYEVGELLLINKQKVRDLI